MDEKYFTQIHLTETEFSRLCEIIEAHIGIRMIPAKRIMLESRLQKRLKTLNMDSFSEYIAYFSTAKGFDAEIEQFINVVTTNKTDFFREIEHFNILEKQLLPELTSGDVWNSQRPLLVWSAASSTGEEAYTLAMCIDNFVNGRRLPFHILGTDISTKVLSVARKGVYQADKIVELPQGVVKRYFLRSKNPEKKEVRIIPDLRSRVGFAQWNLDETPYHCVEKFHIIFCRNVLIYFDRQRKERIINALVECLHPSGYLFLGHSESISGMSVPVHSIAPTIFMKTGVMTHEHKGSHR